MGPQIPQELCEFFIDYLHDDTRALSACSLTCRAWLLTARYHRFHAIIISYDYGRWYYLQELLVTNPYLAPLIQSLRINHTTGIQTTQNQPRVLTMLPSLKELVLNNVMPDDVLFSTLAQIARSSTRHLVINDGHFRHLDDVLKFIASFPRLEMVHMSVKNIASRSAQMGNKHGNVAILPTPPTSIRRVTFGSHLFELADQFIFDWLYLGNIRIDSLTYRVSFKIHSDLLHHMLTKVKDTLEHLCLIIDVPMAPDGCTSANSCTCYSESVADMQPRYTASNSAQYLANALQCTEGMHFYVIPPRRHGLLERRPTFTALAIPTACRTGARNDHTANTDTRGR